MGIFGINVIVITWGLFLKKQEKMNIFSKWPPFSSRNKTAYLGMGKITNERSQVFQQSPILLRFGLQE